MDHCNVLYSIYRISNVPYSTVKKYVPYWPYWRYFQQSTGDCRRQYNEIYFRELFLAAHFSRKFEKPSDKVPTVHFLLCDYRTFRNRNLPRLVHTSKIVLYSIYVIMYVRGNSIGTDRTTDRTTGRPDGRTPFKSFFLPECRKNSPHTPTFSFLVSACTYYFYHFSCTSSDSIYTIDIPPRLRNLHNHFLCAIPFKLLLFIYLSRFFGEIR